MAEENTKAASGKIKEEKFVNECNLEAFKEWEKRHFWKV